MGDPGDDPSADTICGIGNRKNAVFERVLRAEGIAPYPGSLALVDKLQAAGVPIAVVSSSKNAREVLAVAGLLVGARFSDGPIAIVAGGPFTSGELVSGPEPDWSFVRDVREVEFQLLEPPRARPGSSTTRARPTSRAAT